MRFLAALIFISLTGGGVQALAGSRYADVAVFAGTGVCTEGCEEAAANVALESGYSVRYITEKSIQARLFNNVRIWVQPGGDAIQMANAISANQKKELRDWISRGGRYLGYCAGAFFADHKVDDANTIDGLAILPGVTKDYRPGANGAAVLAMNWLGMIRHVFFQEGPAFELNKTSPVEVVATYPDGVPAVIRFRYGAGRVALSAVHPEASLKWSEVEGLVDPDGIDHDLAYELMSWLNR